MREPTACRLSDGLAGLFDADGSAFIIHANTDDQVTDAGASGPGGSGARIACAVVAADWRRMVAGLR